MADLDEIYNTKLLELAARIPCSERLNAPDATATAHSKLCGSTITIDLQMQRRPRLRLWPDGQGVPPGAGDGRDRREPYHRRDGGRVA